MSTTKTEDVIKRFLESTIGRKLLAEAQAEEVDTEERQAKAGHLAALREGRAAFMAMVQAELAGAEKELKAVRENLKTATATYNAVLSATYGRQWQYDRDILEAEDYLSRTAPGRLKTALQSAQDRLERLRSARVERVIFPDLPEAVGMTESDRPRIGAVEERAREMAEATREIQDIRNQILGGGE
ncbi:MAG TPA: hypothetical protein PKH03_07905 [Syntrophales bacterium]|nr:hypothetical protein [Syntrophales bacterium]